ncbi:MAG: immunoglobulin-like domain-containing protein, partial [Patescibacteria group bacterium]
QGWIYSDGGTGAHSASTSPTVKYITSTSTTASTFAGAITSSATTANTFPYASSTALTVSGASYFGGQANFTGSAANIALGSNYLSGDGGDEGIFVGSTGRIGIGTASPSFPLDVHGGTVRSYGASSDASFVFAKGTGKAGMLAAGDSGAGFNFDDSGKFAIGKSTRANIDAGTYSGTDLITVLATGNVGIGESAPGSTLSVSGGATVGASYDTTAAPSNGLLVQGNLGIGTTSPGQKLSVAGDILGNAIIGSYFTATSTTASTFVGAITSSGIVTGTALVASSASATSTLAGGLAIETSGLVYDYSTNNVGIGTASPVAPLHVVGASSQGVRVSGGVNARLTIVASDDSTNMWNFDNSAGTLRLFRENYSSTGAGGGGSLRMTISDDGTAYFSGNLGIGSTSPATTFSVAGNGYFTGGIGVGKLNTTANTIDVANTGAYKFNGSNMIVASTTLNNYYFAGAGPSTLNTTGTGSINIAIGPSALGNVGIGTQNIAIGSASQVVNSAGNYNTSLGVNALYSNGYGDGNVAVGNQALYQASSSNNVGIGYYVMAGAVTTGSGNVGVGSGTLTLNTSGSKNVAVGGDGTSAAALGANTTGANNIGIGYSAGITNTTGSNNTLIGVSSNVGSSGLTNATALGYGATVGCSNCLVLGNAVSVGIGTTSPYAKLSVAGSATDAITFALKPTGSQTANILDIYSNDATPVLKSVITAGGNWGIGTTSPGQKLSVAGDILGNAIIGSYFTATSTTASTFVGAITSSGIVTGTALVASSASATSTLAGGLAIETSGLVYDYSTNKVGIGTASPNGLLSLGNSTDKAKLLVYDGGSANNLYAGFAVDSPALNDFTMYTHNNGVLKFGKMGTDFTTITPFMTITNSGNLGIGTTTPTSLLQVAGTDAPKFTLSDTDASANQKHWFIESDSGVFGIGTTSDALSATASRALSIASTGFGTTTLRGLSINGQATSTSNVGFNLTGGCFAINGTCVGGGGGSGTVTSIATAYPLTGGTITTSGTISLAFGTTTANSWSALQTFTNASTTNIGSTGSAYFATGGGSVGIGSTSPAAKLGLALTVPDNSGTNYGVMSVLTGGANSTGIAGYFSATGASSNFAIKAVGPTDLAGNITTSGTINARSTHSSTLGNLFVGDLTATDVYTAGNGGNIVFAGSSVGQNTVEATFANIRGVKENSTYNNSLGALVFGTQSTSAGSSVLSTVTEKMRISSAGNLGIGTTSPYAALSVVGEGVFRNITATSTTATTTIKGGLVVGANALVYDFSSNVTTVDNLQLGTLSFATNAGAVTWNDLPVTSAAANGTVESYTAKLDGNSLLTVYGTSDGAGGTANRAVGIATTSPWRTLSVSGTLALSGLTGDQAGSVVVCMNANTKEVYEGAGTTCTVSSARFKHNIEAINVSAVDIVSRLRPVTFDLNSNNESHYGFIAEEVSLVDDKLIFTDRGTSTPRGVRYEELTAILTKAIQEQQAQINALASSTPTTVSTGSNYSMADIIDRVVAYLQSATEVVFSRIRSTLAVFDRVETNTASVQNGIEFTDSVTGTKYCVTIANGEWNKQAGTCASTTSTQSSLTATTTSSSTSSGADTLSPVITLNGNNPARVEKGTTYLDPGAIVSDNVNDNLGVTAEGDQIDTSVLGDHTVRYSAIDQAGNRAEATRTVTVFDPYATSTTESATTNPLDLTENATTTPSTSIETPPAEPAPTETTTPAEPPASISTETIATTTPSGN